MVSSHSRQDIVTIVSPRTISYFGQARLRRILGRNCTEQPCRVPTTLLLSLLTQSLARLRWIYLSRLAWETGQQIRSMALPLSSREYTGLSREIVGTINIGASIRGHLCVSISSDAGLWRKTILQALP